VLTVSLMGAAPAHACSGASFERFFPDPGVESGPLPTLRGVSVQVLHGRTGLRAAADRDHRKRRMVITENAAS